MLFYELDFLVWRFHNEWTYYEHHPEIVGKYFDFLNCCIKCINTV